MSLAIKNRASNRRLGVVREYIAQHYQAVEGEMKIGNVLHQIDQSCGSIQDATNNIVRIHGNAIAINQTKLKVLAVNKKYKSGRLVTQKFMDWCDKSIKFPVLLEAPSKPDVQKAAWYVDLYFNESTAHRNR